MRFKAGTLVVILIWSLFMGVTAISFEFDCQTIRIPVGKMDLSEQTYNPYPGNTITTITWYCTDETELGIFPMAL